MTSLFRYFTVLTFFVLSVGALHVNASDCLRDLESSKRPTLRQSLVELGAGKGDFIQYNKTNLDNSLMYPRVGRIQTLQGSGVHLMLEPHRMANGKLSSRYRTTLDKSDYPQNIFVLYRAVDLSSLTTLEEQISKVKPDKGDLIQFNKVNSSGGLTEPLVGKILRFNKRSLRVVIEPHRTEEDQLSSQYEETINFDETILNLLVLSKGT